VTGHGQRRQPQPRGPPFGPLVQPDDAGVGQRDARGREQLAGLALGETQIRRADLGQLPGQAQLMQVQPQVTARRQHRVRGRGQAGQQPGELGQGIRRNQLVQIVDDQGDVTASAGEF